MAPNRTTFGKIVCKGCGHKLHVCGICPRKDCGCIYPADKPMSEKDAKVAREYDAACFKNAELERAGRYIPRVKVKQPKIEHDLCSNRKVASKSKPLTDKKGNPLRVKHKSMRESKRTPHGRALFKGGLKKC